MKRIIVDIALALSIGLTVFIALFYCITQDADASQIEYDGVYKLDSGWYLCEGQSRLPVDELVRDSRSGTLVFENTVPDFISTDSVISVTSKNEAVCAYIDDVPIYRYGFKKNAFGPELGAVINVIPLPSDCVGKRLRVEFIPHGGNMSRAPYEFTIGCKSSMFLSILSAKSIRISICILMLIISLVFTMFGVYYLCTKRHDGIGYIYFGIFVLFSTAWTAADALLFQFLFVSKLANFIIFNCSFLLMAAPFAFFMARYFKRMRKFFDALGIIVCLYFVLRLLLYIFCAVSFETNLWIIHLIMFIMAGASLIACAKNYRNSDSRYLFYAISSFCIIEVTALLMFYLGNKLQNVRNDFSTYFYIGTLLFSAIMALDLLVRSSKSRKLALQAKFLERCAYTDILTNAGSRTAYEQELKKLEKNANSFEHISIILFDMNNLKHTNDTLGHFAGDTLLKAMFQCLFDAFNDIGKVYRVGGDEAVVMLYNIPYERVVRHIELFNEYVKKHNSENALPLDIAFGHANAQKMPERPYVISELIRIADKKMYENKLETKKNRV